MPLYDYKCLNCENEFEARHGFNDPIPPCPQCESADIKRLILTAPTVAGGMMTHPGDGYRASKEQLQDKWSEETPKLRKKLVDKLGADTVNKYVPTLGGGGGE